MPEGTCEADGCDLPKAKGRYCNKHYIAWRRHGDPLWRKVLNSERRCSIEGCENPVKSSDLCVKHYQAWRKWGDPTFVPDRSRGTCSEPGCEKPHYGLGLCSMHWTRQRRHGDPLYLTDGYVGVDSRHEKGRTVEERFWQFVDKDGPIPAHMPHLGRCWLWLGAVDEHGYGIFNAGDRNIGAHRWSYEHFNGPVPDGLEVCHACDTPSCVRGEVGGHLWEGTHAQNMADARGKGRMPGAMPSKPCGTMAAYYRHRRNGEEPCEACWEAVRAYDRARQPRRREQARKRRESGT